MYNNNNVWWHLLYPSCYPSSCLLCCCFFWITLTNKRKKIACSLFRNWKQRGQNWWKMWQPTSVRCKNWKTTYCTNLPVHRWVSIKASQLITMAITLCVPHLLSTLIWRLHKAKSRHRLHLRHHRFQFYNMCKQLGCIKKVEFWSCFLPTYFWNKSNNCYQVTLFLQYKQELLSNSCSSSVMCSLLLYTFGILITSS